MSRTRASIKNSTIAFIGQIIMMGLAFASRTVFVYTLGKNYLGVNGLFSSILSLLSFAELGVGTAIVCALYKPLAREDEKTVATLTGFYAGAYRIIGLVIGIVGMCLIPFLDKLMKDKPDIAHLTAIYVMFLINSVISYFFAHKRSLLIASQRVYINTLNQLYYNIGQTVVQMVVLVVFRQYLLYLGIQIVFTLLSNRSISKKADRFFPYLKQYPEERIGPELKHTIAKNVVGTMSGRLGTVVVFGTDNLLISVFVGVAWVGMYSNYALIVGSITTLISQAIGTVTASVGNFIATKSREETHVLFRKTVFLNYYIAAICGISLWILLTPFVRLWLGSGFLLDEWTALWIAVNFFVLQMRRPALLFTDAYGFYWEVKWKPLIESAVNLVASMIFLIRFDMGISGVLLGTCVSSILVNLWWEPWVVYRYGFKEDVGSYLKRYLQYTGICTGIAWITRLLVYSIPLEGIPGFVVKSIACVMLAGGLLAVIFCKTEEFSYGWNLWKQVVSLGKEQMGFHGGRKES